ncbi:exodeoxyribonuclease VII small subunit [Candidatus Kinetoplastibacterium blastocrithidii TCC012E]|uniref:Exodeoxyribonuclease 7 small subunit n=1 Tax=Candidatus Kinetoplastidibacterium blastocrithidiae TCC012E TaxID=1208922 RepID=M1LWA3_9PROT|nr:exodeoxyribonuclease VII small subunit [Candidatus Kinetoplastibacterium blastocrithidii]AFZ83685.1 exodeoxyribonuclease VII small subunit [Candidatus Kinetoplastibacterium blastocrithidii (ex Strigomonas culicis)]AGF49807.1 exodeoxyribonuclease VII small subunit [Candidatus Kinetoplastibacterium blastocrithidii TCC012E]
MNNSKKKTSVSKIDFETAISELEKLVSSMESCNVTLENSLIMYRRGVDLVRFCQNQLTKAEQEIKILDEEILKPLDENLLKEDKS